MSVSWYIARLRRMGLKELVSRVRDEGVKARWRRLKGRPASLPPRAPDAGPSFAPGPLALDAGSRDAVLAAAKDISLGHLSVFGRRVALPREGHDWFLDPDTGVTAPSGDYAFDIKARDPAVVGNHKFLLEPNRLQHLPLLATAYFLGGGEAYAELAAAQLQSWCRANPFLSGVHWTSGIEVGLRLVSLAWTRRLLAGWPAAADCFEGSAQARDQIYRHQQYLAVLESHGSSANNHLLAELLGLYIGASAFPWFAESRDWAYGAAERLAAESERQVFADGVNREQASDYHGFVLEIFLVAAVEAMLAGGPAATRFHPVVARMADAWAAMMDGALRPPRQGDTDEGRVLSLDPADRGRRAASLLAAAGALVGSAAWWPPAEPDVRSHLFAALSRGHGAEGEIQAARPQARPSHFPDAGVVILRDLEARADELWCRCDHGPHGYLSIAAHGHADALSIELRHGGVDILADPGTYCYLTERDFRRYFRSTIGHNTLEIGGRDQARFGGPFLWLDAPESALVATTGLDGGPVASWTARHSGYQRQPGKPVHERMVTLDRRARRLAISDRIATTGRVAARLAFHLGPSVDAALTGSTAKLAWSSGGSRWLGRLGLPPSLAWRAYRGARNPILGWYSPGFAEKLPATCLIGEGLLSAGTALETTLDIRPAA